MLNISFDRYKNDMVEALKGFIKIESVKSEPRPNMPYGKGIFDALMYIQSVAEKIDLECFNLFGQMGYVDYGYGDEMLGILTHVDVVPAGDGWSADPFEGTEKDGKLYGRGSIDNKGPAIAALYAIKALKDNCIQLNKQVRLMFGTDEETTWQDMEFYKKNERHPDIAFSPDGEFPVINTEKGSMHFELYADFTPAQGEGIKLISFESGTRPNVVPNKAECVIETNFEDIKKRVEGFKCPIGGLLSCEDLSKGKVRLHAAGKSAHGSLPENGVNAAASLIGFLNTLPLADGGVEGSIRLLAERIGYGYNGEGLELNVRDDMSGRLTCCLGALSINNGRFEAKIDIRYPVSYTKEFVDEKLEKYFSGFEIKYILSLPTHYVPEDSPLVSTLKEVYEEVTGEKAYCIAIGGATYARAFPNAVTYGPLFPGKPNVEHGPDEYIEIDTLMKTAQIIANAIVRLCE
jgi:succinyl-diaminopimelate desuccinylase